MKWQVRTVLICVPYIASVIARQGGGMRPDGALIGNLSHGWGIYLKTHYFKFVSTLALLNIVLVGMTLKNVFLMVIMK